MKKLYLFADLLDRSGMINFKASDWKRLITEQFDKDVWYQNKILHHMYRGDGALHVASAAYAVDLIELLIGMGASVNECKNRRLATALHYASDGVVSHMTYNPRSQELAIKKLLKLGADINAADKNGATPLMRAIRCRSFSAVKVLIEQGADWNIPNKAGTSTIEMATMATGRGGSGTQVAKDSQAKIVDLLQGLK